MKKLTLLSVFCAMIFTAFAQEFDAKYANRMKMALFIHDTASTYYSEVASIEAFESIGNDYKEAWLPNYWVSYIYTQIARTKNPPDGRSLSELLDEAQKSLDISNRRAKNKTSEIESDIYALQGFIYHFRTIFSENESSKKEWKPQVDVAYKKSLSLNPENPLMYVLQGTSYVRDTERIGSVLAGKVLLNEANRLFKLTNKHRALTTNWNQEWLYLYWLKFADKQLIEVASTP